MKEAEKLLTRVALKMGELDYPSYNEIGDETPLKVYVKEPAAILAMEQYAIEKQIELLEELHRSNTNTNALFRADLRVKIDTLQQQLQKLKDGK